MAPAKPVIIDEIEYATRAEAAKAWAVPVTTFIRRLNEGLTPSEAVRLGSKCKKSIAVDGKVFDSIGQAAEFYNMSYGALQARLINGWPNEEAVGLVPRKPKEKQWRRTKTAVTLDGIKYNSITAAAKQRGFNYSCISKRLDNGLTLEQAFELEPFPEWFTPGKGQFSARKRKERIKRENELGLRQCKQCKQLLSVEKFSKYSNHKQNDYYSRCKECTSHAYLMYRYNITVSEFMRIGDLQNWTCAICKNKLNMEAGKVMRTKSVGVDHCHATGAVRGLLCSACNNGLGLFRDSVENLARAIEYLNNPPASILE